MDDNSSPQQDIRPEKVVLHVGYPLWRKHTLVAMARAKELQESGTEVVVTHCDARRGSCLVNLSGNPVSCAICRSRVRQTAEENGLQVVPLNVADDFSDLNLGEKKEIVEGVRSAVISEFRQLPSDTQNGILRLIRQRYYRTACGVLTSMKALLRREQPTRVEVFNGRHACSKLGIIAANGQEIPFTTLEINHRGQPLIFEGHTAHDRLHIQDRMKRIPVDMDAAEEYFASRRTPAANKFTKKYSDTFQPPDGAGFSKTVSVFLSSQDEFEALGPEWKSPFPDYAATIRKACTDNPDYLFCIRFHPNQASMSTDFKTPFQDISELPNTCVYYPSDTANSYRLVEWSDVVVTFGSTVTLEACWVGKPVIMLGPSFYDQLDVSYNPNTHGEFQTLLREDLAPKSRENAAALAMYQTKDGDTLKYVSHDGKKMVSGGIVLRKSWLSRIARTSDNIFCRVVKSYSKQFLKYQNKKAA